GLRDVIEDAVRGLTGVLKSQILIKLELEGTLGIRVPLPAGNSVANPLNGHRLRRGATAIHQYFSRNKQRLQIGLRSIHRRSTRGGRRLVDRTTLSAFLRRHRG